jgi:hypothetical protein
MKPPFIVILFSCFYALERWAERWANLTSHCPSSDGSKSGKRVTHFGHGSDGGFPTKFGQSTNFFKAFQAGLTNPHDISDSFTVTPLNLTTRGHQDSKNNTGLIFSFKVP